MIRASWWVITATIFVLEGGDRIYKGDMFAGVFLVGMGIAGFVLMARDLRDLWRREDKEAAE